MKRVLLFVLVVMLSGCSGASVYSYDYCKRQGMYNTTPYAGGNSEGYGFFTSPTYGFFERNFIGTVAVKQPQPYCGSSGNCSRSGRYYNNRYKR